MSLVDHVGGLVADLDGACGELERAGFELTARVSLMRLGSDGVTRVRAGGQNRCVMLERGYVEIQVIDDLLGGHPLAERSRRYQGLHVLAFSSADALLLGQRWSSGGLKVSAVDTWWRPTPLEGRWAEVSWVSADPAVAPEALVIGMQHHTPDLIRLPGACVHSNGARAVAEVLVVVTDEMRAADRYRVLTGATPVDDGHGGMRFSAGRDAITVGSQSWLRQRLPIESAAPDSLAALVLAVDDPVRFAEYMVAGGAVDHHELAGVRWFYLIGASLAIGAIPEESYT